MLNAESKPALMSNETRLKRNILSLCLRNIGMEILRTQERKTTQYMLLATPETVCLTIWTDKKMLQSVSNTSSWQVNGEFEATVKELDPQKFRTARHLPYSIRPMPGKENAELKKPAVFEGATTRDNLRNIIQRAFASCYN